MPSLSVPIRFPRLDHVPEDASDASAQMLTEARVRPINATEQSQSSGKGPPRLLWQPLHCDQAMLPANLSFAL